MSPGHDFKFIAVVHFRLDEPKTSRGFGQRCQRVERSQGARRHLNSFSLSSDLPANLCEDLCLELNDSFFRTQNFLFPITQLWRRESFSVRQRLPALIIGRDARGISL